MRFLDVLQKASLSMPSKQQEAVAWLRRNATRVEVKNPQAAAMAAIRNPTPPDRSMRSIRTRVGQLFMFAYEPKMAARLPYYDYIPVVFPVKFEADGFYGLNLHYLPYQHRAMLMDQLYSVINNKRYDESTRLRLSYDVLSSSARFRFFRPCYRKYLFKHVKTSFLYIDPKEWDVALFLPLEVMRKSTRQRVWNESIKSINAKKK